ncbi:MAG: kanamycin kinase [Peptoniphilaceae bacterium]|nr:kanamycin kinase [Peptoniphilaceae bacterium]MDY6018673.1 kanamycin kinase [Anaerococcus sp.]
MKYDSIDILKKSDFFKDKLDHISKIEKIADNKLKITSKEASYVLGLYPIEYFKELEREDLINGYLKDIGLEPLKKYQSGIMPDINKSYKIFEYRDEISLSDFLKKADSGLKYQIGVNFGQVLKKIHAIPVKNLKPNYWYNHVQTKVNLLLYRHGLQEAKEDRDYILIDYLNENMYLTKNTSTNILYSNLNDKNIRIYDKDKIDIRGLKELKYGDGISDFVQINKISINHPEFARGVLDSYYENKPIPRKLYRLLSFYQVYHILDSLVNIRDGQNSYLKAEEIEEIFKLYDDFSNIKPSWSQK